MPRAYQVGLAQRLDRLKTRLLLPLHETRHEILSHTLENVIMTLFPHAALAQHGQQCLTKDLEPPDEVRLGTHPIHVCEHVTQYFPIVSNSSRLRKNDLLGGHLEET